MTLAILLAAAAAAADAPDLTICADRPSKANGVCTVPTGHWQLEISAVDWARTNAGGARTDVTSLGQTFLKLGLSDNSDIELAVTPHIRVSSDDHGVSDRTSGVGDTVVRYKRRLTDPNSAIQVALIPFVKLPTAKHALGNGQAEGGLAVPVSFAAKGLTITFGPEVDVLADGDGHGYHPGLVNLVNLGFSPAPRFSVAAELWNAINFDPARTSRLWSADISGAYQASRRVQLDGGANFGLNRATPDIELYAGASILF